MEAEASGRKRNRTGGERYPREGRANGRSEKEGVVTSIVQIV